MNKVILKSLKLRNFKGIKSLNIDFNELQTNIYGTNKAGKTTTLDAYTWLLFDKDSTGSSSFSIKTLDSNNNPIPKLEHEVEGIVEYNGVENIIRKVYVEKWTKPRGQEQEVFSGHTTNYYWNDSPLSKADFQSKINDIIPEETFKILTNPTHFNTIHWEERRKMLMSIAGEVSNDTVIDQLSKDTNMELVTKILSNKQDLQESKKALAAKRKRLNDELKLIPSRIDEVQRSKVDEHDYDSINKQIELKTKEIQSIDEQIEDVSKKVEKENQKVIDAQNKKASLERELNSVENEVKDFKSKHGNEIREKIREAESKKSEIESDVLSKESRISSLDRSITSLKQSNEQLKKDYADVKSREFTVKENDVKCSCCGQDLPNADDKKESLRLDFEKRKSNKIDEINKEGVGNASSIKNFEKQKQAINTEIELLKKDLEHFIKEVSKLKETLENIGEVEIPKELDKKVKDISKLIEDFEIPERKEVDNSELKAKRSSIYSDIDELKTKLQSKDVNKKADERIEELSTQQKTIAQEVASLEHGEMQIEQFIKAKMDIVEQRVNRLFATCSFKMFEEQVNGGQKPVCECLVDGVPFHDVNNAGKINAGIDIITALQTYFDIQAPIWIDNRESVVTLFENDSQIVNLIVSKEHKTLLIQ